MAAFGEDDAAWERAIAAATKTASGATSGPKSLTLDGAVKSSTGRLPSPALFERFAASLEELSVAGARLSSLAGLPRLPALRRLSLPDNRLSGAAALAAVAEGCGATLRHLDLGNNRFAEVDELEPLAKLGVEALDLYQCPVSKIKGYREKVFALIPSLKYLDGVDGRGPRAFVDTTYQTLTRLGSNGRPVQYILHSASDMVSIKLAALTSMQHCLAAFLAEIHSEVDRCREGLTANSDKSLHTLFIVLNTTFSKLEVSLRNAGEGQDELFTYDGNSYELFEKLPEVDVESPEWTEALSTDGISLIYQNLQKLDSFLSSQLTSHKRPNKLTVYWLPYTCGALGLSVCSLWLLRHSSLMGSPDIDNWIQDAKESVAGFWDEHVEKPIISIRDELFETFKQRDKGVMENQEVQLTEDSLRRMLVAFCEQTEGQKLPEDSSVQAMLEILTKRYEKELIHPMKNLFSGELARAMLIQIQKLKLDLESGLLEMDQILRANAINFAVLAALPAFGLSLLLLMLLRTWIQRDHGAEGRGNIARCQRRLLLVDVERRLMEFQHYRDNGMEEEARYKFGLVLYTLDRLCKAVESHAKETGEWLSLREDIFDLAKLDMGMPDKMIVVSRLKWMYNCLLPFSSSRLPRL